MSDKSYKDVHVMIRFGTVLFGFLDICRLGVGLITDGLLSTASVLYLLDIYYWGVTLNVHINKIFSILIYMAYQF